MPTRARAGSGQSQELGPHTGSPTWVVGVQALDLISPRVRISMELELEVEPGLEPRHPHMGCRYHYRPKCLPPLLLGQVFGFEGPLPLVAAVGGEGD